MKELKDMNLHELWQMFPIILREYSSEYSLWYNEEKLNITQILIDHFICRISHIGSTSVPGLIAKPIVDILVELPENFDIASTENLLQQNGWILMHKDDTKKIIDLNKGYTSHGFADKVFHLHVKPYGDWGELYFRDYLRENSKVARQYEKLKQDLLKQFEYNRDAYTDGKSAFVIEHTKKARMEYGKRYLPSQHYPNTL